MKNNKISLSSREVVTRDLPLEQSVTVIKQGKETLFHNKIRRCRITDFRHDRHLFNNVNGFTLIELLVVVLIIGILAAVAVPQYQKAVDKSRYSNLMAITNTLSHAAEVYYLANGTYPTRFDVLDVDVPATTISGGMATFPWGNCYVDAHAITCLNNTSLKNGYIIYHKNISWTSAGRKACYALTTQAKSRVDQVCAAFGKLNNTAAECYGGTCRLYFL